MMSIDPGNSALYLDVDGTLVDIQQVPEDVTAPADLPQILSSLMDVFGGAVAIVSGRQIKEVDRILSPLKLVAAGVHGVQLRLQQGGMIETTAPKLPAKLLASIMSHMERLDRVVVELKDEALAVHYRLAPHHRDTIERIMRKLVAEYGRQLEVSKGRMVFEIVPRTCSKGHALRRLSRLAPFEGRTPIMIGDDAPDVSAMGIAKELGGVGLTVGGEYFPHATADFSGPAEVRAWLKALTSIKMGI